MLTDSMVFFKASPRVYSKIQFLSYKTVFMLGVVERIIHFNSRNIKKNLKKQTMQNNAEGCSLMGVGRGTGGRGVMRGGGAKQCHPSHTTWDVCVYEYTAIPGCPYVHIQQYLSYVIIDWCRKAKDHSFHNAEIKGTVTPQSFYSYYD